MSEAKNIEISVILPIYNCSRFLKHCLESIFDTNYLNFEMIVINDGSSDESLDIAKDFPCQIIDLKRNSGPAAARNIGIKRAKGNLLLFTDADCIVQKNWVKRMHEEYAALNKKMKDVAVIGGRILPNNRFVSKCIAYAGYYAFQHGDKVIERPDLCAANLLVVKKTLEEVGGFREDLINGEDTDLTCKIYERGYKVVYDPKVYVIHDHRKSMFDFFRHQRRWGEVHGLQLEIRYQKIRKLKFYLLINNPYLYLFLLSIPISIGITFRSIRTNFKYDKKILIYAIFVFISKLYYRYGVVKWLFKNRKII